ncbi:MAG TPA: ketose-bisphosphate aldolase [Gammaproteobacteria bacterium]|nr:ketose-bisphosphate aldolase [Gammaproteobacteria bacterium]
MPLVNMRDMLNHAYRNGYAVGAFDLVSLDFIEAILSGAEACRAPVILSLAESHFEYYDFELAMAASEVAARRTAVPVAIHLDHGASFESAVKAINLGCNGVMVDASQEAFDANVSITRRIVNMAHACGIPVEGELGYVAGVEGEDAEKHPGEVVYTSVEEARDYVKQTGVDCLAVSIGTVHGRMQGEPALDFDRLQEINARLGIPLVIHGGTGLSDDQFRQLIANGVSKINYYTALADAAGARMRGNTERDTRCGYTGIVKGIQDAMREEIEHCMEVWGSAGQADAVLGVAEAWRPVQHVIIYNTNGKDETVVAALMHKGKRVLSEIPGVRRVITGNAVKHGAKYQYCWLVEFVHEQVIDSYRANPAHVDFADRLFRPVAGDRISIDYLVS